MVLVTVIIILLFMCNDLNQKCPPQAVFEHLVSTWFFVWDFIEGEPCLGEYVTGHVL